MNSYPLHKQKGVTLIVALIMLLILAMVGATISKDATIQERMSSNNQQQSVARINAHSALIAAEQFLESLDLEKEEDVMAAFNNVNGLYMPLWRPLRGTGIAANEPELNMTAPTNWNDENSILVGDTQQRFFIEYMGFLVDEARSSKASLDIEEKAIKVNYPMIFRITALGYGAANANASILQSTYSTQQGI